MKKYFTCLFIFISVLGIRHSFATTYYISNSGNDSYTGTRPDSAWQTIGKLNATTLQAGDSVLFETGGIFRGQINLLNSGATGQPIYFGSYNSNPANPVISGCKVITGWTQYSGNIYTATVSDTVSNLFEGKVMKTSARYPNSGFLTIDSSGTNTGLYDPRLNIHTSWTGARLKVRSSDTKYEDVPVDSFSNGWLSLATPTVNTLSAGYGYYIDHDFQDLDTAGEWYYDTSSHSLFVYTSTAADTANVEATVFGYGINAAASNTNIRIQGIDFENQGKDGALFTGASGNISFLNCNFRNCYLRAIHLIRTSLDTIDHCTFTGILGDGIVLGSNGASASTSAVTNCQLSRIGIIPGYGLDSLTQYNAISFNGSGNAVVNNLIDTIGFMGITFSGMNNLVDKNYIKSALYILNNGSAINITNGNSGQSTVSNNFIFNTIGNNKTTPTALSANGITLNQSFALRISHNTIVNSTTNGIFVESNNHQLRIQDNVVYNSGTAQLYFLDPDTSNDVDNDETIGNIFYCLNDNQYPMYLDAYNQLFYPSFLDSNYYCNPYGYFPIYRRYFDGTEYYIIAYTLKQWTNLFNDNSNSKTSLVSWDAYSLTDTIANQLIENGDFTDNFDGWDTNPTTNNDLLLDNDIGLDGGCAKFSMIADTPFIWGQLRSPTFNYLSNQTYKLSFSAKASSNLNVLVTTKQGAGFFNRLGFAKFFPLDTGRTDFTQVYKSSVGADPALVSFEMHYPDSTFWLDNVHLYPVTATYNDSSKLSRLITNYSPNTVSISLGDSVYHDLDGKTVQSSYTLAPYSSYVLTLDSPLFEGVKRISPVNKDLTVFPNPLNPSFQPLYYSLVNPNENSTVSIQLIDLFGEIIFQKSGVQSSGEIEIPSNIPEGFYIFQATSAQQFFEKKLLIFH